MVSKKSDIDPRRALELLRDTSTTPKQLGERLGASPEAVDEARVLLEELPAAEADAILALPPVLARALLHAAAAAGLFPVLEEALAASDKELQREAKRILHNLRLRGVEVPIAPKAVEPPAPAAAPAPEPPVFLSTIDGRGERAILWTRALPGRGYEVAQLVVAEACGVAEISLGELSRKRFRELAAELPRRGAVSVVEVGRDAARTAIDRARAAGRERGTLPAEFVGWSAQVLGPVPATAPPPLAPAGEGRAPADPRELDAAARASGSLFAEPELGTWVPDDDALRRCALHVEEAAHSPLYLEGAAGEQQREEAVAAAIERAAGAFFDAGARPTWAERLLDTAFVLELDGRTSAARHASAAAARLVAGAPSGEIGFCRELFHRLFPKRAAAPKRAAPVTTSSGLILPPESLRDADAGEDER